MTLLVRRTLALAAAAAAASSVAAKVTRAAEEDDGEIECVFADFEDKDLPRTSLLGTKSSEGLEGIRQEI
ncbi:hypothetical protein FS842_001646 [Serendipita sp. 407]|nr:hypothetical protein FS842_001646 [Serendipita sp. 407]